VDLDEWFSLRRIARAIWRHLRSFDQKAQPPEEHPLYRPVCDLDRLLDSAYLTPGLRASIDQAMAEAFPQTWTETDNCFHHMSNESLPTRCVLAYLKERGYDRHLRAGIAFQTLILSRSLEHGLVGHEAFLEIDAIEFPSDRKSAATESVLLRMNRSSTERGHQETLPAFPSARFDEVISALCNQPLR
jgi:hypothetical protein